MDSSDILAVVVVVVVVFTCFLGVSNWNTEEFFKKEKGKRILDNLKLSIRVAFEIDLDAIHESGTQDEIVRIVNLLAYETSSACVIEDRKHRGEHGVGYSNTPVSKLKREWSKARNLALKICPELKDRLPHFSEFEPLKSYRETHLLEKKEKKARQLAT